MKNQSLGATGVPHKAIGGFPPNKMGLHWEVFKNGAKHWGTTDWGRLEEVPRIVLREIEKDPGYHKIPRVLYALRVIFGDYHTIFMGIATRLKG